MQLVTYPSWSSQEKEVNTEKQKVYTAILCDYWLDSFKALQANNLFVGFSLNTRLPQPAGKFCDFCGLCY